MKKILVCLVMVLFLVSCATLPIDKLKPGMTQAEVEELFNQKPVAYMRTGTCEAIDYVGYVAPVYTLYFLDGKLVQWHYVNSGGTGSFVGVTIPMPAPPVRY